MNKINELINNLCPNGVRFVKLEELCPVMRGKRLTKSQLSDSGKYVVYHGSKDTPLGFYDNYNVEGDTVIVVNTGGIGGVKYNKENFWCSDGSFWIKHNDKINNKFLYYYLVQFEDYYLSQKRVGGVPTIDRAVVSNTLIPVPPMEIQDEIVRILDSFTTLATELTAELKVREKQYDFYKEKLLSFSKDDETIKWVTLGSYCKRLKGTAITAGKMKEIESKNGNVKIFAGGKTVINTDEKNIPAEDIIRVPNIIVQSRGVIDFIYYDKPCSFKREMWSYTLDNEITLKYIYYYLKNDVEYFRQRGGQMGSMPQISLDVTEKYKIPLPSLTEQERIVNALEKFDKLCNDTFRGLPAEIESRRKQYEYYRDKLLTFKELKVSEV